MRGTINRSECAFNKSYLNTVVMVQSNVPSKILDSTPPKKNLPKVLINIQYTKYCIGLGGKKTENNPPPPQPLVLHEKKMNAVPKYDI